ncbi:hypothetical protein [Streptacidiphilus fuscans]|uniref:Secreted protein n=1 Tax=Streptacidiphilus fuscans TaxID=2789292 RepID=A0A931FGI3_9ACTN|nr:hypothetical protein [Streptacidiphilus fuscans]MBF9073952.1 hypothetical protein [Streptacidiphilus fuscans]
MFGFVKARRLRRLSATLGAVAAIGVSTVVVAPSAHADDYVQHCGTYHSWTECISFDYTTETTAVNALNGYSYDQTESLYYEFHNGQVFSQGIDIPAHSWRGFSEEGAFPANSDPVCAGIGDVANIVCADF